ncbi:hypothetical protein BMS3Abin07_01765 [bacterium BMS3Abin07]|nr:hypothetical protein BMS3Abin07_01765 [bacterium BMS3Abin07]
MTVNLGISHRDFFALLKKKNITLNLTLAGFRQFCLKFCKKEKRGNCRITKEERGLHIDLPCGKTMGNIPGNYANFLSNSSGEIAFIDDLAKSFLFRVMIKSSFLFFAHRA